jgi:hypothetical protein
MPCHAARFFLAAALGAACQGVAAQDTAVPPAALVQQLAPQLLQFAGSQQNFQNLVNGLAQGAPIQLTTLLPGGASQIVSFTPTGTLTPTQIAQLLESTRQQLIGLGIGNPTGEQIGAALLGTSVPTPLSPTAQTQNNAAAAGATAPNALSVQTVPPRVNTSDSPVPAGATSRTPTPGNVSNTPIPPVATPTPPPAQPTPEAPRPGFAPRDGAAPRTAR